MTLRLDRFLFPAFLAAGGVLAYGADTLLPELTVKARFIVLLGAYVDWPPSSRVSNPALPFVIGTLGRTGIVPFLDAEARSVRTIKGKPIRIRELSTAREARECDLLFISETELSSLDVLLAQISGLPVVTIADVAGLAPKGVMFNMRVRGDRFIFEVALQPVRASSLQVDARVLARAVKVER